MEKMTVAFLKDLFFVVFICSPNIIPNLALKQFPLLPNNGFDDC